MGFQEKLYQLRRARGLSQESLAEALGVSRQAVQKWESGAASPDTGNLIALSDYFGVTLDSLLKDAPEPPRQKAAVEMPLRRYQPFHYEYRSKRELFGLPLVHIHLGNGRLCRAKGILAIGNIATGVLALGGISAGAISLGGLSIGLLALGGLAVGGVVLGGIALGLLAAIGGLAISSFFAVGGAAISGCYALGGAAVAGRIAAGGAAFGPVAVGDAARGQVALLLESGVSAEDVRAAILAVYPNTAPWIVRLFSFLFV